MKSRDDYGITLRGPTRPDPSWQARTADAYGLEQFAIDWERRQSALSTEQDVGELGRT